MTKEELFAKIDAEGLDSFFNQSYCADHFANHLINFSELRKLAIDYYSINRKIRKELNKMAKGTNWEADYK